MGNTWLHCFMNQSKEDFITMKDRLIRSHKGSFSFSSGLSRVAKEIIHIKLDTAPLPFSIISSWIMLCLEQVPTSADHDHSDQRIEKKNTWK